MRKLGTPADLGNAVALLCFAEASCEPEWKLLVHTQQFRKSGKYRTYGIRKSAEAFENKGRKSRRFLPSSRYEADTINAGPGPRYDVIWPARKPGKWLIHCHIPHHTENDNVEQNGGGGLTMWLDAAEK